MDYLLYITKQILKESQATGLRERGVFFEPFSFLGAGCSGNQGKSQFLPLLPPVPCGALTVIGISTLPQVR